MKWLRIVFLVFFLLLLLVFGALHWFSFRFDFQKFLAKLPDALAPSMAYYERPCANGGISMLDNGNLAARELIIFLHGAPGSAADFSRFFGDPVLNSRYRMVAMERPGYGSVEYGLLEHSIRTQGECMCEVLKEMQHHYASIILVGHSYGAPVALAMSAVCDASLPIQGVLVAGGLVDPAAEKIFWFNPIIHALRGTMPSYVQMANDEKLRHAEELRKIEDVWPKSRVPIYVLHGAKDWIAPLQNVSYMESKIPNTTPHLIEILEDKDHILQFAAVDDIIRGIEWLVAQKVDRDSIP